MRILDRYLLREFCIPLLYCLDAFALLWIVMDLFGLLDDFMEHQVGLWQVFRYYVVVIPEALVQIIPMGLLLGLLFCLANLGKHNELLAMRAGGVSLIRLTAPFLSVGLAATLIVFVVNLLWVPGAREHSNAMMRVLRGKGAANIVENLFYTNLRDHRDWYARQFNATSGMFDNPEVHQRDATGAPVMDVYAQQARWTNGQWLFTEADIYDYTRGPNPVIHHAAVTNFPAIDDKPRQLLMENKSPDEMSHGELRRAIRTSKRSGREASLAQLEVTLHARFAFPVTCLMVVWLGIPLGMNVARGGALKSVGIALLLVIAFHFGNNITLALGSGGRVNPALAAWLANIGFAIIGAVLFLRQR